MINEIIKQDFNTRVQNMDINDAREKLVKKEDCNDKFHVVYVMGNTTICGAAKIIFQQANRLIEKGLKVTIVAYFRKPSWFNIECDYIQVPFTTKLSMCIPYCDLIIATYYTHIGECVKTKLAPVIYFEQGDFHLFCNDRLSKESKEFINLQFQLANDIFTVSNEADRLINSIFHREANVIHNGIDRNIFNNEIDVEVEDRYILMMGSDRLEFKGIQDIIAAYSIVKKQMPDLKLYWITPVSPSSNNDKVISQVFISPSQENIGKLYKNAEIFVNGSYYESFSLPVIEAMACGCPVITTDCIGVRDYVVNKENALITSHSPHEIADRIIDLAGDKVLQDKLMENGLETVKIFSWEFIIDKLYTYYCTKNKYETINLNKIEDWKIRVREEDFLVYEDYQKFIKILRTTTNGKVYVPFQYKITDEFSVVRWEEAAYREDAHSCAVEYSYTKTQGNQLDIKDNYTKYLYENIRTENYEDTIIWINSQPDIKEDMVYKRWVIYCLIKLKRFNESVKIINDVLDNVKHNHPDIYYLQLLIPDIFHDKSKREEIVRNINIYGDGIIFEEFIVDIISVTEKLVDGSNQKKGLNIMEETFDYAVRLYENKLYDEAIKSFMEFVEDNKDGDKEKIIEAYRKIYYSYYYKGMYDDCRLYCYMTFKYTLPRAEECCFIGYTYLQEKNYEDAAFWYELATTLDLPRNNEFPVVDKAAYTWKPFLQLCVCYYNMGKVKKSFEYNELAKSFNPTDKNILQNVEFFRKIGYETNELKYE
ncbi:hypothetical protein SH1V18_33130 [Vallitalea longa]|uniref:Glycosyl transferase family 1 domain-containing protein n=1 Tax=Vallitalea longa TaxID=2936439 RepID=A0A9W5YEG1_9FIRM|nr:glycosyltransferase family 4 protein [Vallitalea longa]GKX30833.1 hypothetical protein SH1V18_33130 [Vallitalea longa]